LVLISFCHLFSPHILSILLQDLFVSLSVPCFMLSCLAYLDIIHGYLPLICGGTVVKVLCYKLEGHWFNSRWCHWNFSLT
jgi:hypothetical protein